MSSTAANVERLSGSGPIGSWSNSKPLIIDYPESRNGKSGFFSSADLASFELLCRELGNVTVFGSPLDSKAPVCQPALGDSESDLAARAQEASLIIFLVADVPRFWSDLRLVVDIVDRQKVALLLLFSANEFTSFAERARDVLGESEPMRLCGALDHTAVKGVLWFRKGLPTIQPVTALDWKAARLAAPARPLDALYRFLLAPMLAQQGLGWKALPTLNRPRWFFRAYAPLAMVIFLAIGILRWESIEGSKRARQVQLGRALTTAQAERLDESQSLQLGVLKLKMLSTDETLCAGIAAGRIADRMQALDKLPTVDAAQYSDLLHSAIDQEPAVNKDDLKSQLSGILVMIMVSLPESDSKRWMALTEKDGGVSPAEGCWFEKTLLQQAEHMPKADRVAVARLVGF